MADTTSVHRVLRYGELSPWAAVAVAIVCIGVQTAPALLAQTGGGTIQGQVSIVTRPSRRLSSAGAYPGRTVTVPLAATGSELANVIVFVDLPKGVAAPPGQLTIRQTNEVFVPRVAAITAGSTVDFPNDDPIFHNVFSLSRGATFDLGPLSPRRHEEPPLRPAGGREGVLPPALAHDRARARVRSPVLRASRRPRPLHDARLCRLAGTAWWPGTSAWARSGHDAVVASGGQVSLSPFSLPLTDTP